MRLLTTVTLTLFALLPAGAAGAAAVVRQQPPGQGQAAGAEDLGALNRRVRELYEAKKYEEAARLAQTAVEAAERQFGQDSLEAGAALMNLANIYVARRDSAKAKKAMARVIELRAKRPGPSQQFERDALEGFTCLDASNLRATPDLDLSRRIYRILVEDSVLEQGYQLSPDKSELKIGEPAGKPQPDYPAGAKAAHASGVAVMRITVDESGRVVETAPLGCSTPAFVDAGASAARRASFKPTLVNGKPVRVRGIIFYRWIIM